MQLDLALDSRMFIIEDLDLGLQELDLIFNTENTELIDDPKFGSNFYQFLWQLNPVTDVLEDYIRDKIDSTQYLSEFPVDISIELLDGELRNIYYVKISVYDKENNEYKYREYQLR